MKPRGQKQDGPKAPDRQHDHPAPGRGGVGSCAVFGLARARPLLVTLAVIVLFAIVGYREHTRAGVRSTRASLIVLREAIDRYRASQGGKCPARLERA